MSEPKTIYLMNIASEDISKLRDHTRYHIQDVVKKSYEYSKLDTALLSLAVEQNEILHETLAELSRQSKQRQATEQRFFVVLVAICIMLAILVFFSIAKVA